MRRYAVVIEKTGTGFGAHVPDLPGCVSTGRTIEETDRNIREAIELFLETLSDDEVSAALSHQILTTSIEVHA